MPSKLCPHSLVPTPDARAWVQAGCPLVKLVNDFGPANEYLAINPRLTVIGRGYTTQTLLEQLQSGDSPDEAARVEYAVIALLLRRTEFAPAVLELAAGLSQDQAERLKRHYTAAVYLQRMYRPALEIYLGPITWLPDYFTAEMDLPSPDDYYGITGLRQLVDRLPPPINWWDTYLHPVKMLIRFLSLEKTYGWKES